MFKKKNPPAGPTNMPMSNDEEALVKKIKNDFLALGVDSFMVFFPSLEKPVEGFPGKDISIYEQIQIGRALPILLGSVVNMIQQESANPKYNADYAKMFLQFLADLKTAIKGHNERLQEFNKKEK